LEIILKYFDDFSEKQLKQFSGLSSIYHDWNARINVISRKDMDNFYIKHVLHSLAIATTFDFQPEHRIVDIGTGGGFPGVPLAIFFPEVEFVLADSIKKKLLVVDEVCKHLQISNVKTHWGRVEDIQAKNGFDFAVSRAVAPLGDLWKWAAPLLRKGHEADVPNGLICLKGGDLSEEISQSGCKPTMSHIYDLFHEEIFKEKYMLYVKR
jgi:16S rRNA (guanine527-N7)-methyltransferase